jgi:hypothetical protein
MAATGVKAKMEEWGAQADMAARAVTEDPESIAAIATAAATAVLVTSADRAVEAVAGATVKMEETDRAVA